MKTALIAAIAALSASAWTAAPALAQDGGHGRHERGDGNHDGGRRGNAQRGDGQSGDAQQDAHQGNGGGQQQQSQPNQQRMQGGGEHHDWGNRGGEHVQDQAQIPGARRWRGDDQGGGQQQNVQNRDRGDSRARQGGVQNGGQMGGQGFQRPGGDGAQQAFRGRDSNGASQGQGGGPGFQRGDDGPRNQANNNDGRGAWQGDANRRGNWQGNNNDNRRGDWNGRDDRDDHTWANTNRNGDWHHGSRGGGDYRRFPHNHRDFYRPRYADWRHVPHGGFFDYGYVSIIGGYYGYNYRWWNYPGWHRPYRRYVVGGYLPDYLFWEPLPYDLYYDLPPAPYGCRYVLVDHDILLIVVASGLILDALLYYY